MIRVTQTHVIKQTMQLYESEGWKTIYFDLPGGQRSGTGMRAQINSIWEKLYNLSPDILFARSDEARLFEVDDLLTAEYVGKFLKYKSKEDSLMEHLGALLGAINLLTYGFVARRDRVPAEIDSSLCPLYFYHFVDMRLTERIIMPSQK